MEFAHTPKQRSLSIASAILKPSRQLLCAQCSANLPSNTDYSRRSFTVSPHKQSSGILQEKHTELKNMPHSIMSEFILTKSKLLNSIHQASVNGST